MSNNLKNRDPGVVDLTDKVLLHTAIPQENYAALRSGFAGYPANPRWSASKFRAWKTGCQLREALKQGQMVVRTTDCMLVPAAYPDEDKEDKPPSYTEFKFFKKRQPRLELALSR